MWFHRTAIAVVAVVAGIALAVPVGASIDPVAGRYTINKTFIDKSLTEKCGTEIAIRVSVTGTVIEQEDGSFVDHWKSETTVSSRSATTRITAGAVDVIEDAIYDGNAILTVTLNEKRPDLPVLLIDHNLTRMNSAVVAANVQLVFDARGQHVDTIESLTLNWPTSIPACGSPPSRYAAF